MSRSEPPHKTLLRRYDPLLLRIIPLFASGLIRLLMGSCRLVRVEGLEKSNEALARSGGRAVYTTWHQRMSYHFHLFGTRGMTVMVSRSRDGEYGAKVARRLGFETVRGSSSRGGTTALREIIRRIKEGESAGMLADGPLGPPRVAKIGAVAIARSADAPIIPVLWGADRCWVLNTWDRYLIPKPFARLVVLYAEPIFVPRSAKGELISSYRGLLEERLNEGARWCDLYFGKERPWRKKKDEGMPEIGPLPQVKEKSEKRMERK